MPRPALPLQRAEQLHRFLQRKARAPLDCAVLPGPMRAHSTRSSLVA